MATGDTESILAEARAEVAQADNKAATVLTALGIGFAALFAGLIAGDWTPANLAGVSGAFWWVGASLAMLAVASAGAALWPRFSRSKASTDLYYWGHVSRYQTLDGFLAAVRRGTLSQDRRAEHQLWHVSRLVYMKYFFVRCALTLAAAAGVVLLVVGIASLKTWTG